MLGGVAAYDIDEVPNILRRHLGPPMNHLLPQLAITKAYSRGLVQEKDVGVGVPRVGVVEEDGAGGEGVGGFGDGAGGDAAGLRADSWVSGLRSEGVRGDSLLAP